MSRKKLTKKQKRRREFLHYLIGTLTIIFLGHYISTITGLESWAVEQGLKGLGGIILFVYYLIWYIANDQLLHKIFRL